MVEYNNIFFCFHFTLHPAAQLPTGIQRYSSFLVRAAQYSIVCKNHSLFIPPIFLHARVCEGISMILVLQLVPQCIVLGTDLFKFLLLYQWDRVLELVLLGQWPNSYVIFLNIIGHV